MHRLRENRHSESESLQPILRRLTEIEPHLRLTETPQAPRPTGLAANLANFPLDIHSSKSFRKSWD